jgi:hypothetical protein
MDDSTKIERLQKQIKDIERPQNEKVRFLVMFNFLHQAI